VSDALLQSDEVLTVERASSQLPDATDATRQHGRRQRLHQLRAAKGIVPRLIKPLVR
jgi:hypothetical protein